MLAPDWPAPSNVRAVVTTRAGGRSLQPYDALNLATHVGDDPADVAENRRRLLDHLRLAQQPCWLEQVHGSRVVWATVPGPDLRADAVWTDRPGPVCAVLTADCLPVLFASADGRKVAAAHAGWRGLAGGILEATVRALGVPPPEILAWLGPAISQEHFEVGTEVRQAFVDRDPLAAGAFTANARGRWQADLYELARQHLKRLGITEIRGGGRCTFRESELFFSHRRDSGRTGRMASLIWLE